jgi:hypothetical protein
VATVIPGNSWIFPVCARRFERWGILPKAAHDPRVAARHGVSKVVASPREPVDAVLRYMERHQVDLIVLATHQHEGRWLDRHSVASRSSASPVR